MLAPIKGKTMKYNLCKDSTPENTINRIKTILNNFQINIKEEIIEKKVNSNLSITAIHLKLNNMPLTNGKGTSKINAEASAYGELMERTQNQIIFGFSQTKEYKYSPDSINISFQELKSIPLKKYFRNKNLFIKMENILDEGKTNNYTLIPFFNIKDKNTHYIPLKTLLQNQMSNGMCAGNTPEEAIIQGLSEICERYSIREIILNKIFLPTIPEKEYLKYETISEIIKYYRTNGYRIIIKDASLGKNLPVICTQIEDKENNILHLSFGAHPSLPIAIERCLTEFIQCRDFDISNKKLFYEDERFFSKEYTDYLIENDVYALTNAMSMRHIAFEINSSIKERFINDKKDYEYSKRTWLKTSFNFNNKEILKYFINKLKKLTNNNIYIRNVSYLDFPAFYIFIPKISILKHYNSKKLNKFNDIYIWLNNNIENYPEYDNINSLLSAMEFRIQNRFGYDAINNLKNTEIYIALLCSILLKDTKKINIFVNILLSHNFYKNIFKEKDIILFKMIKDKFNEKKFKTQFNNNYTEQEIEYFENFINNLNYKIIKEIVIKNITPSIKIQVSKDNLSELLRIRELLEHEYEKNIPSQENIKDIFNFI